jgi:hypothetical protein
MHPTSRIAAPRYLDTTRKATFRSLVTLVSISSISATSAPLPPSSPPGISAETSFVQPVRAVAWAGAAPASDMRWYYTDPFRTQGFRDYSP